MAEGTNVDVLQPGQSGGTAATGPVAQRLLSSGMSVQSLRTNDVLRKEEWLAFDQAVVEVARKRLVATGEIMNRGLTYPIQNALGTTQLQWERMGDLDSADLSMAGVTDSDRDRLTFELQSLPLPIIHKDFNINIRALEASRSLGQPLDTAQAQLAGRIVSEKIEELLFLGSNISVLGSNIPGLTTESNRHTGNTRTNWDTDTTDTAGQDKVNDVIDMIDAAAADNMFGPFVLFVTQTSYNRLADDYKPDSDKTQLQRLQEIPGVESVLPSKDLAAGNVLLVQMTQDVIDEVDGLQPTTVQWATEGGMTVNFKVMAIMVPRVRSTKTGQSGVVHYTP